MHYTTLKILIVSPAFLPAESHGGVPFCTSALSTELARLGSVVKVITTDRNGVGRLDIPLNQWTQFNGVSVYYCSTGPGPYSPSVAMRNVLAENVPWADVVVSSGTLWNHAGILAMKYCRRLTKPHVVYLHGLLEKWAFRHKLFRKKVFWHWQGKKILQRASLIIALADREKDSIRCLGIKTPIEVIPNGISDADSSYALNKEDLWQRFPHLKNRPYLLFLGRISEKKGLDLTIRAFSSVYPKIPGAVLVIAGPVEPGYKTIFDKLIRDVPADAVEITGPVKGETRDALHKYASGFILTSYSEGMPMAILEAMSFGVPVIVTPQCNIPDIGVSNAGWMVDPDDIEEIKSAITELFIETKLSLDKGMNAKNTVIKKYNWPSIGMKTYLKLKEIANSDRGDLHI